MRNFEQRMAEIKSRSNMRIAHRRKQLTSCCVMLVLTLCVGGILLTQPAGQPYNESALPVSTIAQQCSCSVTVLGLKTSITYTDREKVESILQLLASLPPETDVYLDVTQAYSHHTQSASAKESYTFILETEDGKQEYYSLSGNVILQRSNLKAYALTDTQRTELLELLELPTN